MPFWKDRIIERPRVAFCIRMQGWGEKRQVKNKCAQRSEMQTPT